jgi:hypothetical protein
VVLADKEDPTPHQMTQANNHLRIGMNIQMAEIVEADQLIDAIEVGLDLLAVILGTTTTITVSRKWGLMYELLGI